MMENKKLTNQFNSDILSGLNEGYRGETSGGFEIWDDDALISSFEDNEESNPKPKYEDNQSYLVYNANKDNLKTELFKNVIGHTMCKNKIIKILNWFDDLESLKEEGIEIPRGFILHGPAGNGKSLILKDIINSSKYPVYVYKNVSNNTQGLYSMFEAIKQEDKCIVVIDELDLLIDGRSDVTRALQECLDGISSSSNFLVIAATNIIQSLARPLLRKGRFDYQFYIGYPSEDDGLLYFKELVKKLNVKIVDDLDEKGIKYLFNGLSFVDIRALVNDIRLNYYKKVIDEDIITMAVYEFEHRVLESESKDEIHNIAVHEASHAFVINLYNPSSLASVSVYNDSGVCKIDSNRKYNYKEMLDDLVVAYAGTYAERIVFGLPNAKSGNETDLENARIEVATLIDKLGYKGCFRKLAEPLDSTAIPVSEARKRKNEQVQIKILKKAERKAKHLVKKNIKTINAFASILETKFSIRGTLASKILDELKSAKTNSKRQEIITKYSN